MHALRTPNPTLHHPPPRADSRPPNLLYPEPISLHHRLLSVHVDVERAGQARGRANIKAVPEVIPDHEQAVAVCFEGVAEDVSVVVVFGEGFEEAVEKEFSALGERFVFVEIFHVDFEHVEDGEGSMSGMWK